MKKILLLSASVALLAFAFVDEASARRGGGFHGGGGFRGAGFHGGGFRGAAVGSGFRGAAVGGGFRTAAIGGFRGAGIGWSGRRVAWSGPAFAGRRVAWAGSGWHHRRHFGRRGFGWPVLSVAAASPYYYDSCWRWNGWDWVNVCYGPAYYPYW